MNLAASYQLAAEAIRTADALLIGAGAGMGVDSGLPDFRGTEGFWRAYPMFQGRRFEEISNPIWFDADPAQAWGFFGHRLQLYRHTQPHAGFELLRSWGEQCSLGYFVYTSNVDGQFQKALFPEERIVECHGSIHHLQCTLPCDDVIWPAVETTIAYDPHSLRATPPWPECPQCGRLARPHVLMFNDSHWLCQRTERQYQRYHHWLGKVRAKKLVVIELGAGTAIPTVRLECESAGGVLIRCNPRDTEIPAGGISLPLGALEALGELERIMRGF